MIDLALYCILIFGPPLLAELVIRITEGPRARPISPDPMPASTCIHRDRPSSPSRPPRKSTSSGSESSAGNVAAGAAN